MDTYRDLLDLIYAMPFNTGLWPKIMSQMTDMTGSMGAILQSPALVSPIKAFSLYSAHNLDAEALIASVEPYAKDDPFSGPMLASIAGDFGRVAHGFAAVGSLDTLARNPFWNEHMGAMAIGDLMALILHEPKDQAMPVLTLVRQRGDEPYRAEAIARFQALAPHLRFATRLLFKVQSLDQASTGIQAALHQLPTPCALFGASGNVTFANQALSGLVSNVSSLQLVNGHFSAKAKATDDRLQQAIMLATRGARGGRTGSEIIVTDANDGRSVVLVTPLGEADPMWFEARPACAAAFVLGESLPAPDQRQIARLKATLNLSEQEAFIAKDLLTGLAPEDIAMVQGKSLLTVRTQIRSLLGKNNLRRVVDLQGMRRLFNGVEHL